MERYKNNSGESTVTEYAIGDTHIVVKFRAGECNLYSYTYASAGADAVETMKQLAVEGEGLGSYIKEYAPKYESKGYC